MLLSKTQCVSNTYSHEIGSRESRKLMDTVVNTSINIPATLYAQLASLAEEYQESIENLLIKAAETIVDQTKRREAWRQKGIDAWEEYKETGLHLTNAEMRDWLAQLASGNDVESPKCHL